MLSPYAEVYYSPTDNFVREQNTNKNEISTQGKNHEKTISIDTDKEDIRENINYNTDTIPKPNKQKKVYAKKSNRADNTNKESPKEKNKLNKKKDTSNHFSVVQDNEHEEEIESCSEDKDNEICKEASDDGDEVKSTYNVESMRIEELNTYLTQDVEDNVSNYKKKKSIQSKVTKDTDEYQEELYYKDHHKVTREILLHENRIQAD